MIRGGCFYASNRKVTHWFGAGIGLEDRGFRQAAAERIRSLGPSGNGAWVFWLDAAGEGGPRAEDLAGLNRSQPQARFSIRHPVLHRVLGHQAALPASPASTALDTAAAPSIARLPAEAAVAALASVARILAGHQEELYRARTEPAHARWSERAGHQADPGISPAAQHGRRPGRRPMRAESRVPGNPKRYPPWKPTSGTCIAPRGRICACWRASSTRPAAMRPGTLPGIRCAIC